MEWSDEGVILGVRPHGESGAVAEVLTRTHGRHLGLVHGGRSRKLRPVLQIGPKTQPDRSASTVAAMWVRPM